MDSPGAPGRIPEVRRLVALLSLAAGVAALTMAVTRPVEIVARGDEGWAARDEAVGARDEGVGGRDERRVTRRGRPGRRRATRARSVAAGLPWAGALRHGRLLPAAGRGFVTWDPILKRSPNRAWRRHGTARLVHTLDRVLAAYDDRPVLVGDLSRPHGGGFGPRFGGIGHASHQNGLDADVYYPRADRRLRPPRIPGQVDKRAAQHLVDAFVAAGAIRVFVGPALRLRGPPAIVQPLPHHDNHLHVRLGKS
jgi:hypothetical protein